ncbi:MAG TPA: ABC transporter ATP-binding protein [Sphaerochaeta sp.]|nr:ABC transporter ATP-binding protein [Sphaerochaeta sp.]
MILRAHEISFRYRNDPVLSEVNLTVAPGQVLSILGSNGAGKTTLLKTLNRVLKPQGGSVYIEEMDTAALSSTELAQRLGWVPQHGEATAMKVFDLILLGRKPHFKWAPRGEDYEKVREIIAITGLEELAMRYADELSGGEFQQVLIARALAQEPKVILLDEPTSSLDIRNQHRLMMMVRKLIAERDKSAVIAMHDLNLALRYSDRFLLLKDGNVYAEGDYSIITPEAIAEVYGVEVSVAEVGGYSVVVPLDLR